MSARKVRGDALRAELARRFVLATERVSIGAVRVELMRPRDPEALIDENEFARDERLPYWADLWPSARVLASDLVKMRGGGHRLLELGCGLGLVTIAAMHAGFEVLASDYYEDALRFTRANARTALGREPATRLLDWRSLPDDLGRFDVVAAADVLYERAYGDLVASVIARTLAKDGTALIADPGRVAASAFVEACEREGLQVVGTEVRSYHAGTVRQRIAIYAVEWKTTTRRRPAHT